MLSTIILDNETLPISFQIIKLYIIYFYKPRKNTNISLKLNLLAILSLKVLAWEAYLSNNLIWQNLFLMTDWW